MYPVFQRIVLVIVPIVVFVDEANAANGPYGEGASFVRPVGGKIAKSEDRYHFKQDAQHFNHASGIHNSNAFAWIFFERETSSDWPDRGFFDRTERLSTRERTRNGSPVHVIAAPASIGPQSPAAALASEAAEFRDLDPV